MEKEEKQLPDVVIQANKMVGEQIIFDILIKEKLAHVIVIKDGYDYHINLDGEDLGHFCKDEGGKTSIYPQRKGAHQDLEAYFDPIITKIDELNK